MFMLFMLYFQTEIRNKNTKKAKEIREDKSI